MEASVNRDAEIPMSRVEKILLIGNYSNDNQVSMLSFAMKMHEGLSAAGCDVELIRPEPFFGRLYPGAQGFGKWLGYLDKFLIFPFVLRRKISAIRSAGRSPMVHICDHSNAVYTSMVKRYPHVVTCHDLIAVRSAFGHFPQNKVGFTGRMLQHTILRGLQRSAWVVCDSVNTCSDLTAMKICAEGESRMIHLGLNYDYQPLSRERATEILSHRSVPLDRKFILHVGNNSWYKNRDGVLRIFDRLAGRFPAGSLRLVFVGAPFSRNQRKFLDSRGLGRSSLCLRQLSYEELQALYSLADALLYPSFYEGFGWPPLEAQACGCPVVASTGGSLPEVLENSALTAEAEDEEAMARNLEAVLRDKSLCNELMEKGFKNVKRFSRKKMIEEYIQIYREILASHTD